MEEADFKRDLKEAEMVLVGLGGEFDSYGFGISKPSEDRAEEPEAGSGDLGGADRMSRTIERLRDTEYAWLIPAYRDYLRGRSLEERKVKSLPEKQQDPFAAGEKEVGAALEKLRKTLEGKNYFLVSQAQNVMIPGEKWREGRLVMPCGSILKKQCKKNCGSEEGGETCFQLESSEQAALYECCENLEDWVLSAEKTAEEEMRRENAVKTPQTDEKSEKFLPEEVLRALKMIGDDQEKQRLSKCLRDRISGRFLGRCPRCGGEMVLNVVQAQQYDERGYLSDWQRYTRWLQGSVNRKLLVLELGVGMQYPGMIRIPFERVAFLNQKSRMYRIHENLYQIPENLREKGLGIAENAIDWLNNL